MLSVREAGERLIGALSITESETILLEAASGRVLAETVLADRDSPAFANSSMDGFAVRAEDLKGADSSKPKLLKLVGDIPAGKTPEEALRPDAAMRIMTGAPLPAGADAVVPVEDTDVEFGETNRPLPERVGVARELKAGAYVRPQGQDFVAGQELLDVGRRLKPQDVALLAMLGRAEVLVHRKPKVALLSSGDELVAVGEELAPGQIYDSNGYSLAALAESCGAEILWLGIAPDDLQQIKKRLDDAVGKGADLILSSAGVSVGAFDYLRDAVESEGELDFWRVNMRPGKPLAFGQYRGLPYIGLPGNPVSAFVSFEVFGRPALNHMSGEREWKRAHFDARLREEIHLDGRESYLRGACFENGDGRVVNLTGHQGSGNLYSLVQANCLIVVPAGTKVLKTGSIVETWPL